MGLAEAIIKMFARKKNYLRALAIAGRLFAKIKSADRVLKTKPHPPISDWSAG